VPPFHGLSGEATACEIPADAFIESPTISYVGEPVEQAKLMIVDPSGNLIELKAYRHPEQVLGISRVPDNTPPIPP